MVEANLEKGEHYESDTSRSRRTSSTAQEAHFYSQTRRCGKIILTGIEARFGRAFLECMIKSLTVNSCDTQDLIVHIESDYDHELLLKRIYPVIETIISGIYDIHPVISIVFNE